MIEIIKEFKNHLGIDCLEIKSNKYIYNRIENRWFEPNENIVCYKNNIYNYDDYDEIIEFNEEQGE